MAKGKTLAKQVLEADTLESARERMRRFFSLVDKVVVSFSGGKDSTVVLNLALEVARERGRLPLEVVHYDEEAIHPPTVDYVTRVSRMPDVDFKWMCVPLKHRNACSYRQPYWWCWAPEDRDRWVRPLPEGAVTEVPGMTREWAVIDYTKALYSGFKGTVGMLIGIRADESLRRYRIVSQRTEDNWLMGLDGNIQRAYPIYDWSVYDVWTAPRLLGWDVNETYKLFDLAGWPLSTQRVCPPFGEEPLRGLHLYAECFPDLWHKMLGRVEGVATAGRYANTELYSVALDVPPDGMTWREYSEALFCVYEGRERDKLEKNLRQTIGLHHAKSTLDIREDEPDPITGASWKFLCKMIIRGDMKGRTAGNMLTNAPRAPERQRMDLDDAIREYGTPQFQEEYFTKNA